MEPSIVALINGRTLERVHHRNIGFHRHWDVYDLVELL